jgi:uracil-DNA glycosylase family 4
VWGDGGTNERVSALAAAYTSIHEFAVQRDRGETPLTARPVERRALDSDLLLLAQGLAEGTQRVTGYPYRKRSGLSDAGRRLDGVLRPLGYTIDHTDHGRRYAYSTDLIPWYPGRDERGRDLKPTDSEVDECCAFFEREVAIVVPKAVVLLGRVAARAFLNRYAGQRIGRTRPPLPELGGRAYAAEVGDHRVVAVVAWHPSAAYGKFTDPARVTYEQAQRLLAPILGE